MSSKTMKAGVAVDKWKVPVFKRHLDQSGFVYTEHPGVTRDTAMLKVVVAADRMSVLHTVIRNAQHECRANGRPH